MEKAKKIMIIVAATILGLVALVIIFISPISKYLVEKYDVTYTGREIKMDWAYVNPFTGYVYFHNFKAYEYKSDSIFIASNGVSANFEMFKLLSKTYEISELTLTHPNVMISQTKKNFNFSDLVETFSPKEKNDTIKRVPVHFNILKTNVIDGEIHYCDELIPINYFIKRVNIESSGKRWDVDTFALNFSFASGVKTGDVKGNFMMNINTNDYRLAATINKFDLEIIEQYLKDLSNYGSLTANLDADINSQGNFYDEKKVTYAGWMAINDFHFGKNPKEDYASFDKFLLSVKELSPDKLIYNADIMTLTHPFFKYELYENSDNLQAMFGKGGAKIMESNNDPSQFNLIIEIAHYIKMLSKDFFKSNFKIGKFGIEKADFKYVDYTTMQKFTLDLNPLEVYSETIDQAKKQARLFVKSDIKPFGKFTGTLGIDPKDSTDFDLTYNIENVPISMLNPYTIAYTSFPLDRGTLQINGNWNVRNGYINSKNHLLIVDPRVASRVKNKDAKWIPMRLAMAFIRERGNVIDYDIPITGNLKDPKFNINDVISDLVKNIFVKPPTVAYGLKVKNVENELEKTQVLEWELSSSELPLRLRKFAQKISNFVQDNPKATIDIYPQQFTKREKESIYFFEAKKKYYCEVNNRDITNFSKKDSIKVEKMGLKDAAFITYLNKHISSGRNFTIQDKCVKFVGSDIVNVKMKQLSDNRAQTFMSYFDKDEMKKRVNMHPIETVEPYNGFSYYKIVYNGATPKFVVQAREKLAKLDERQPRKKFQKVRKKVFSLFQ